VRAVVDRVLLPQLAVILVGVSVDFGASVANGLDRSMVLLPREWALYPGGGPKPALDATSACAVIHWLLRGGSSWPRLLPTYSPGPPALLTNLIVTSMRVAGRPA
jgi:hypothetical protein